MGKWCCGVLAAIGGLALAGCTEQRAAVSQADAVTMVRTGRALLNCREACLPEWRRVQPQAAQLDAARHWPELAALLLQTGYEDDLSLYYLGRAAEGVGFPGAAASYYRQSLRLAGTVISCQNLSRLCGGVALPRAASFRLAAIDRQLNPPRRRRIGPAPAELAEPDLREPEPPPIEAPRIEAPRPIETAPPAPAAPGPSAGEFIEPPPAPR